jgi:phytoene synthase
MSGVTGPITLEKSYERCRLINRRHGTSFYWATYLLPKVKRRHVHALYGFCRVVDDLVDDLASTNSAEVRQSAVADFGERFFEDLRRGRSEDPVLKAVVHTVKMLDIEPDCFRRFLRAMTMDFTVQTYETFDALLDYMDGSAIAIGDMLTPILAPSEPEAFESGRHLAIAFQLTNILRDVAEDLDRGRVYLPQEDLRSFDADPWDRTATPGWRALMAFEIARTRHFYQLAELDVALLPPASAGFVIGATRLYSGILDMVESAGYDVFTSRAHVPTWKKVAVGLRCI